jgi:hypothetical protein
MTSGLLENLQEWAMKAEKRADARSSDTKSYEYHKESVIPLRNVSLFFLPGSPAPWLKSELLSGQSINCGPNPRHE